MRWARFEGTRNALPCATTVPSSEIDEFTGDGARATPKRALHNLERVRRSQMAFRKHHARHD
jgi:hypothetical protein